VSPHVYNDNGDLERLREGLVTCRHLADRELTRSQPATGSEGST
jgi:hypothetical protein